jgi:mRNA interferase MazF
LLPQPSRGEVWHASFDPIQGREQGMDRPCLIVSSNYLNQGPSDLIIVLPITTTQRHTPFHIPVDPPDGGLTQRSYIMCEQIRALDIGRLHEGPIAERYGTLSEAVMREVEDKLRMVLELPARRRPTTEQSS